MKYRVPAMLAGSSLLAIASTFAAQAQNAPATLRAAETKLGLEEIIVTARRKEETLQDVPQTVTAVTAEMIEDLNILRFNDLDQVVAGLQLQDNGNASLRGVTFNTATAAFGTTVAYFLNDAAVTPGTLANALFDTGQVEFLRGPQGTTRGVAAPSGAINYTTRRVDLGSFGGGVGVQFNDLDGHNVDFALNVPLIEDKLGIRLAGLEDVTDSGGVESVNHGADPRATTRAGRITVRFEPTDTLSAVLMYQHMQRKATSFTHVFGPGAPGGINPNAPANFNGPPIDIDDYLSVQDQAALARNRIDLATAKLDWAVLGQRLSYIGAYLETDNKGSRGSNDTANYLPGYEIVQSTQPKNISWSHEFRIASDERIAGMFDYVIGAFDRIEESQTPFPIGQGVAYLPGAFGPPGAPTSQYDPQSVDRRYERHTLVVAPRKITETSFFANATAHLLDDKLEVSAGARYINAEAARTSGGTVGPGSSGELFTSRSGLTPAQCTALGGLYGATYAGVCDVPIPMGAITTTTEAFNSKPWIWDASIAYHFTPNLMTYVHAGSSWREGPFSPGIVNGDNDPVLFALQFHPPEESESYEVGLKWLFLDRRGRLNVDYYYQEYANLFLGGQSARYMSFNGANFAVANPYPFTASVPAKVDGFDLDLGFEITSQWRVSGAVSWADGRVSNALVPCNDGNFDGVPDSIIAQVADFQAAGVRVATCQFSGSTLQASEWNGNLQSEFHTPLLGLDAFARGLLNYQPSWTNANAQYEVPAYYLLNLYLGVRDPGRKWEVTLYGRNVTDTHKLLAVNNTPIAGNTAVQTGLPGAAAQTSLQGIFGPSGYTAGVQFTPRREFGVTLRYRFGGG